LKRIHPKGALVNRGLKDGLLDWGFSDAMMAVGSMQQIFREAMRQIFVKSARFSADGSKADWAGQAASGSTDREFIVVSHSLGSYLVFSTLSIGADRSVAVGSADQTKGYAEMEDLAARYILERTSLVYFFANQVSLLELANLEKSNSAEVGSSGGAAKPTSLGAQIKQWQEIRQGFAQESGRSLAVALKPPQVIAWSDPSDLLSWRVPGMDGVIVVNLFVRNTWWHWLFASPSGAHDNYATNTDVIRIMLGPSDKH
jgi:hypothetical protein